MKKVVVVLLSILFFAADISCSEEPESNKAEHVKSSVLVRFLKPLAVILPFVKGAYEYSSYATKPCGMDKYPHAKNWYKKMDEKYLIADLHTSEFCEGTQWEASSNRIFAPAAHLQFIDQAYFRQTSNKTTQTAYHAAYDKNILNINEFALLHEAGHRKNNDYGAVTASYTVSKKAITRALLGFSINSFPVGMGVAYIINKIDDVEYTLKKEIRADKFACDYAQNVDVLQGGLSLFNYLAAHKFDKNYYYTHPDTHPAAHDRAQKVADEIKRRSIVKDTYSAQK